ncbi:hypothetical protein D3C71_1855620 [compost metagenome]
MSVSPSESEASRKASSTRMPFSSEATNKASSASGVAVAASGVLRVVMKGKPRGRKGLKARVDEARRRCRG